MSKLKMFLLFAKILLLPCIMLNNYSHADEKHEYHHVFQYGLEIKRSLYSIADQRSISEKEKMNQLVSKIMEHMDIEHIGKYALGRYYKQLSAQDQSRYLSGYKKFMNSALRTNAKEALLVPSKNVKLRKHITAIAPGVFDISYHIQEENSFMFILTVQEVKERNTFRIINISVDNIDIITSHKLLLQKQCEQDGIDSIFKFMKEASEAF